MEENAAWCSVMPAKEHDDAPADDVEPGSVLFESSGHPSSLLALAPHLTRCYEEMCSNRRVCSLVVVDWCCYWL
jgi:hypothetical protein